MAYQIIAGFEQATPGSYERGRRERQRQDELVRAAGGVVNYMRGCCNTLAVDDEPDLCYSVMEVEGMKSPAEIA